MSGLNPEPGRVNSIASRIVCAKCFIAPTIVKAEGTGPVSLTVSCHGKMESRTIEKREFVFTQRFFEQDAEDADADNE